MFGETTISYVKIRNHPIETTIYKWLFGVPGSLANTANPTKGSSKGQVLARAPYNEPFGGVAKVPQKKNSPQKRLTLTKTNMASWKIPIRNISSNDFKWWILQLAMLVFFLG